MAATTITLGYGTLLQRGDGGGPENFTTIAEALDITIDLGSVDTVDSTHQESPDNYKEVIAGLNNVPTASFSIQYLVTNSTQNDLITDKDNTTKRNFKLVLPDTASTEWTFSAYVTGFTVNTPVQDKVTADVTFTMSTKVSRS